MTSLARLASVEQDVCISECGRYRYSLSRSWDGTHAPVLFVMLNPSTADARQDDPTIRRCIRFARDWGYGGLLVGNLFAYRATNPADLPAGDEAVGPENDAHLRRLANEAGTIVAAWGAHRRAAERADAVARLLGDTRCLRVTKAGAPWHPLYLSADASLRRWKTPS